MRLILSGVLLCVIKTASGGWLRDIISPKGWHVGNGLVLHLVDSQSPNSTFLERHSIMMDYGGLGVTVAKIPRRSALEVGLYADGLEEGRGYHSNSLMNIIIGYKLASVVAIVIGSMGMMAFTTMGVAKVAIIVSLLIYIAKLLHKQQPEETYHEIPAHFEIEHPPTELHSDLMETPSASGNAYYTSSASNNNYYPYAMPLGTSDTDYVAAESSPSNTTYTAFVGNQQVSKRRDVWRNKKVPVVTIHEYSAKS